MDKMWIRHIWRRVRWDKLAAYPKNFIFFPKNHLQTISPIIISKKLFFPKKSNNFQNTGGLMNGNTSIKRTHNTQNPKSKPEIETTKVIELI